MSRVWVQNWNFELDVLLVPKWRHVAVVVAVVVRDGVNIRLEAARTLAERFIPMSTAGGSTQGA